MLEITERRVALAGDWHGARRWAVQAINDVANAGIRTVLHLGDLGVWHGNNGATYSFYLQRELAARDVTVYVTLGNHENYEIVNSIEPDANGVRWWTENVALLARPQVIQVGGVPVLSFGGAASIDREFRVPGSEWWPGEMPTETEVDEALAHIEMHRPRVVLTHDSAQSDLCTPSIAEVLRGNPHGWSQMALDYAATSRGRVDRVVRAAQKAGASLHVHGHHHIAETVRHGGLEVLSLGMNGDPENLAVLDVTTGDWEWVTR